MHTATIVLIEKEYFQADNCDRLVVTFNLTSGEVTTPRKLAFPLETTEEAISDEITRYCARYNEEMAEAEQNKARNDAYKQADETISSLTGKQL